MNGSITCPKCASKQPNALSEKCHRCGVLLGTAYPRLKPSQHAAHQAAIDLDRLIDAVSSGGPDRQKIALREVQDGLYRRHDIPPVEDNT